MVREIHALNLVDVNPCSPLSLTHSMSSNLVPESAKRHVRLSNMRSRPTVGLSVPINAIRFVTSCVIILVGIHHVLQIAHIK